MRKTIPRLVWPLSQVEVHTSKNLRKSSPHITTQKANRQRDLTSLHIYTEMRSGRATPEISLFFVCPLRGAVSLAS